MEIRHTLIHKSCWEKRLIAGVSWDFFVYWIMILLCMLPICLKQFWFGISVIGVLFGIYYLAKIGYEKDSKYLIKFKRYYGYQSYYPAVAKFSSVHSDVLPKTYCINEGIIMKLFNKIFVKKDKKEKELVGDYENPYITGRREWMERYGDYISQNVWWRRIVIILLFITVIVIVLNFKLATSYKVEAQIFAQSPSGSLQPITPLDKDYALANQSLLGNQIQDYIVALRTVNPDQDLLSRYQNKLSAMTDNDLFSKTILPIIRSNFDASNSVRINIHLSYVYPDGSYDKEKNIYKWVAVWDETAYDSNNNIRSKTYWMANIKLGFFTPKNATTIKLNPLSVLVEDVQIHNMLTNDQQDSIINRQQAIPSNVPIDKVMK